MPNTRARPHGSGPYFAAAILLVLVVLLAQAGWATYRRSAPPSGSLATADALFTSGQYYAALQQYTLLAASESHDSAAATLRVGMVRTIRAEFALAESALWEAIRRGLSAESYDLAVFYLGHVLSSRGQQEAAERLWQQTNCAPTQQPCPYAGPRAVLRAGWAFQAGDYSTAERDYRAAFALPLPNDWRTQAIYRLSLLQAARSPEQALSVLQAPPPWQVQPPDPFLSPLLPATALADSARLYAVLQSSAIDRVQLLGQLYLDLGLDDLALHWFEQVADDSPHADEAAAFALYTRWRLGQQPGEPAEFARIVASQPASSRAQVLLALVTIVQSQDTLTSTDTLTGTQQALAPQSAETYLAWALWYLSHSDYVNASSAYQRAIVLAAPAMRGRYALLAARFSLTTGYEICTEGTSAAREAVERLPDSADAWATLAGSHYQCYAFAGASAAARRALSYDPQRADASFYLGAALARLEQEDEARAALIRAADLAPASIWRERAEGILTQLF